MNHVVALKRDRATGANLLVATTDTGALGLFVLRGPDVVPLVATAPAAANIPAGAGHSDLVRCAALCNSFVVTGAEDSRVCSWTAAPLPDPSTAAPAAAPAPVAAPAAGTQSRADSRGHARKQRSAMSPY